MSIFQVTGTTDNVGSSKPITEVSASGEVPFEPNGVQQTNASGNSSQAVSVDHTNVDSNGNLDASSKKEEPTVVLDGPLGRIYTEALNLVYAKEESSSMQMALVIDASRDRAKHQIEEHPIQGTFVYAIDASDLTSEQVIKAADWMTERQKTESNPDMIISLETHHDNVSKKSKLIEDMAKAVGAKVVYSRRSAMEAISKSLKK